MGDDGQAHIGHNPIVLGFEKGNCGEATSVSHQVTEQN